MKGRWETDFYSPYSSSWNTFGGEDFYSPASKPASSSPSSSTPEIDPEEWSSFVQRNKEASASRSEAVKSLDVKELPYSLVLATVTDLLPCAGSLLRAALFPNPNRFVFFTQQATEDELSVIADTVTFSELPREYVRSSGDVWRAFEVCAGAETIDQPGIVSETTARLAAAGVPLVYISTWFTDVVLVPESQRQRAWAILNPGIRVNPLRLSGTTSLRPSPASSFSLSLDSLPGDVSVAFVPASRVPDVTFHLLRILVSSAAKHSMLGVQGGGAQGGITLILDSESRAVMMSGAPADAVAFNRRSWCVLQVEGAGDSSVALVQPVSAALAAAAIPVFFLGTARYDFVLVPAECKEKAIACLSASFQLS